MAAAAAAVAFAGCRAMPVDAGGAVGWSHGFLVAPAPGSPAVLYLWLENPTGLADTVAAVGVADADSAQVHGTMAMGSGMETMTPVAALPLPPHDTVTFAPGGLHIMVFGLRAGVRAGDSASVTVSFRRAGDVKRWARVITYAEVDSAVRK